MESSRTDGDNEKNEAFKEARKYLENKDNESFLQSFEGPVQLYDALQNRDIANDLTIMFIILLKFPEDSKELEEELEKREGFPTGYFNAEEQAPWQERVYFPSDAPSR